jgi:catechol 2,3-dioxygenase-like lactoylglutathione lyase family enzyme
VSDIVEARAKVEALGVVVEAEGVAEGMRRFFVRDPAGNRIELAQT